MTSKIKVIIPAYRYIEPPTYEALLAEENLYRKTKSYCKVDHALRIGDSSIDMARSDLARIFIEKNKGSDYLMFIDSDIYWDYSKRYIEKLAKQKKDIICGIYSIKSPKSRPALRTMNVQKWIEDGRQGEVPKSEVPENKVFKIYYATAGFTMYSRKCLEEVYAKYAYPFQPFVNSFNEYLTEDFAFSDRARQLGFEIWADSSIKLGHIGIAMYWL